MNGSQVMRVIIEKRESRSPLSNGAIDPETLTVIMNRLDRGRDGYRTREERYFTDPFALSRLFMLYIRR